MLKKYLFSLSCLSVLLLASCTTQNKNLVNDQYRDRNYYDGTQSDLKRNVDQLEKRIENDEKKMDVTQYDAMRPK